MTLLDRLKQHEGFRSLPYRDGKGVLTIGYGRNLDAKGIDEDEGEMLLKNDIDYCTRMGRLFVPGFDDLDPARQGVMVEMIFNLGLTGFLGFRKMLLAVKRRDWETAEAEMRSSKWWRQVGKRAETLSEIMLTGQD